MSIGAPDHASKETLLSALEILNGRPANIIETGSAAHGTRSSLLFDSYVNSFGGTFSSVDIRVNPLIECRNLCTNRSRFFVDDSVAFLQQKADEGISADLIYLDSWDVNWSSPLPPALHGLNEFISILPLIKEGTLLLVDDTPANEDCMRMANPSNPERLNAYKKSYEMYGVSPGKGSLINLMLRDSKYATLVKHKYQLLYKFERKVDL